MAILEREDFLIAARVCHGISCTIRCTVLFGDGCGIIAIMGDGGRGEAFLEKPNITTAARISRVPGQRRAFVGMPRPYDDIQSPNTEVDDVRIQI